MQAGGIHSLLASSYKCMVLYIHHHMSSSTLFDLCLQHQSAWKLQNFVFKVQVLDFCKQVVILSVAFVLSARKSDWRLPIVPVLPIGKIGSWMPLQKEVHWDKLHTTNWEASCPVHLTTTTHWQPSERLWENHLLALRAWKLLTATLKSIPSHMQLSFVQRLYISRDTSLHLCTVQTNKQTNE